MESIEVTYIGIDIGRSKVALAAQDANRQILRKKLPRIVGDPEWKDDQAVAELISSICQRTNLRIAPSSTVVIGAAGALEFERTFDAGGGKIKLIGDLTLARLACGVEESGVLLSCGTGGALAECTEDSIIVHYSYGPLIGDFWGGVFLGRRAVRYLVDAWVRESEMGEFGKSISELVEIRNRKEYVSWLQRTDDLVSGLGKAGKIVIEYAERGEPQATQIVNGMILNMADATQAAVRKKTNWKSIPIGVQGSIIEESLYVRQEYTDALQQHGIKTEPALPQNPLEITALEIARRLNVD